MSLGSGVCRPSIGGEWGLSPQQKDVASSLGRAEHAVNLRVVASTGC